MVKVEENKVLSVIVDDVFAVEYDSHFFLNPLVFYVGGEDKELIDTLDVKKEPTIEELKVIALEWYKNHVKETKVAETTKQEVPTIAQLNLYSEDAMRVDVKNVQFIIGKEIPILQIIKNDEVVTDYIEVGDTDEIYDIADLERYAIKWYYKNELGMDF
ncbi:hypothetical protein GMB34_13485 [Turicibacter sanguinis]|nr:hypothetical protein [Turicibacter sanguinis]MTN85227.1 hypothetical protein [Turicibacter sanguinis]MTN88048.1 hypothetical protein [Turicibacter sanguinis]MTN90902.1 hypothetical protein [Turicibacter sanguinis]MTN93733.1 hypothetical protein [Turicibacter sanguinis]